ncbi:putative DEAD-like helicase [Lyophyllum shimeji]|uniref:RNA helicase n=1 Tax=Lyophyllum shimeji TaxID=47721 RepID=A0A9P3PD72_LYOSH|nr:putative DEAD-like helicase [Lyophyllum shimeji]
MARSAALNPASMPFFPGGLRGGEDDGSSGLGFGFRHHTFREQDRNSMSSLSISPSEYRSAKSSPSPPLDHQDPRSNLFPELNERPRQSPTFRQVDAGRPHPGIENRTVRESSLIGSLDTLPEGDDNVETPGPTSGGSGSQTPAASFFSLQQRGREHISTPPVPINQNGTPSYGGHTSSSPVSSLDSGSQFAPSGDHPAQNFETQLKASPLIHDILSRLVQCEYATREIQRDLGDLHHKVTLLVERSLGNHSQPEFKDPFAPANTNGHSFSSPPPTGPRLNGPRPSLGNIAPNQPAPADDISAISQRLNTLTSSVGQLLAMQTQQLQTANSDPRSNSIAGLNTHPVDIAPNQTMPPPNVSNSAMLGHGLPLRLEMRSSARHPNPPLRTWSAGTLDLPVRPSDPNIGRQENIVRDKRRSVTALLRRDSSGVLDVQGDNWASGSPRDAGPVISKWEQLSLTPELLRSLNKFGVGPPNKIQQRALPFLLRGSDIIAQAPPTQERIAAYVIPAIQIAATTMAARTPNRGPIAIMISTTVDQATQAQRMIRDLGGPIGVRSALGVGATSANNDLTQELRLLQQNMPHIICGTPQKLHALFTSPGGLPGSEVRFLVLDEVDQLIARNLHDFVFNIVKLLPPPRSRPAGSGTPNSSSTPSTVPQIPFNNTNIEPSNGIVSPLQNQGRRFSTVSTSSPAPPEPNTSGPPTIERQTALFSNTVPQDVLNLASAIQLREPVRVLVRRDGNVSHADTSQSSRGLRQFYLYLAFTAGGRADPTAVTLGGGLGIIGSGRGAATSAETVQAREWKLDALADLFDDVEVTHAIVHVGGMTALDSVVYKLASRGLEAVPLHGDMNAGTKLAALNKFRNPNSLIMRPATKVLVVYDVQVKTPDVSHVPLIINYDLPKAVEEYAHRVSPAIANNYARAGVVVNFVTATGGDVEMLRSIECFYKIKCPEVPMSLRDVI